MEAYVLESNLGHKQGKLVDISHIHKLLEGEALSEFVLSVIKNTPSGWKIKLPPCDLYIK